MKISIITVCYNSSKTIEDTLKSVCNQSYGDIEYIVVDGASTDNTSEILSKYDHIISKKISEKDKGLYDAMNKGLGLCTGDYVGIINSDDTFYDENVISNIVMYLKLNKGLEACTGNIIQHNEDGKTVRVYDSSSWEPERLKIGFMPPHPSIFFKRSLFEAYGNYQIDFKIAADYELITRFFLKNEIKWSYSNITTTAMLTGGVSSSGMESYKMVTKEIFKALDRNGLKYSKLKVRLRILWKVLGLIKK